MMKNSASDAAAEVGQRPPRQEGRSGHGQASEPVDHARLEVLGKGERGGHSADEHRLKEDRRDDVVHVIEPRDVDGPPEHVAEQKQDDRRLHDRHGQQLWCADDAEQVPLGHPHEVPKRQAAGSWRDLGTESLNSEITHRWSPRLSAGPVVRRVRRDGPVKERNTSSSEGRRIPRSSRAMPPSSSARPAAMSTFALPLTGRLISLRSGLRRGGSAAEGGHQCGSPLEVMPRRRP